jgi:hypothetical protein
VAGDFGWLWKYGRAIVECSSKEAYFHCLQFKKKTWLLKPKSTDHIHHPLRKKHKLGPGRKITVTGIMDHVSGSVSACSSSLSVDYASALITKLQLDIFKKLMMRWIVRKRITFTQVESDEFRDVILYLHRGLSE